MRLSIDREPAARPIRWLLVGGLAVWLFATHYQVGYFGLPYWACLTGPIVLVFGPWAIAAATAVWHRPKTNAHGGSRRSLFAAAIAATAALVVACVAVLTGLVPHAPGLRSAAPLVVPGVLAAAAAGAVSGFRTRRLPGPLDALVVLALAIAVESDVYVTSYWFDRDFHIFLRAGLNFLEHSPVYFIAPARLMSSDPSYSPFVYPPPTLPLFAMLARLPGQAAEGLWFAAGLGASVASLRLFGVGWRWLPLLLLWPPFVQGLFVGNADIPILVLYAAAPAAGLLLAIPPLVKLQLGATAIWLVRERRWRQVVAAMVLGAAIVMITLPVVGVPQWRAWVTQLQDFSALAARQTAMEGIALVRLYGLLLAAAIGVGALAIALLQRGKDCLASLGLASLAVSPTLYPHGLTFGLPGLLRLRAPLFWAAVAVTSSLYVTSAWWLCLAAALVTPMVPWLSHERSPDPGLHPLGSAPGPWANVARREPRGERAGNPEAVLDG